MGIRSRTAIQSPGRPRDLARKVRRLGPIVVSVLGLLVGLPTPGHADIPGGAWYVAVGGADGGDCQADSPCATVSYALSKIVGAGTIWVGAGTYRTNIVIGGGRAVTVAGAGMGRTVLDGGNVGRVVTENDSAATLQDLSVVHGHTGRVDYVGGGGALSNSRGTLRVIRSRIADSWTDGAGGGISSESGELSVIDSMVATNTSDGLGEGGGIAATDTTLTVTRSTVSADRARLGGGLYVDGSHGTTHVTDSTIAGNTSSSTGTGAAVFVSRDTLVDATHVTIAGNHADAGGVVAIDGNGSIAFAGSMLAGNAGNNCVRGPAGILRSSYTVDADGSCGSTGYDTAVDPMLVPLLDGGGQTTAYSFPATSIAHDAIPLDNPLCDGTDQHGVSRRNPNVTGCDEGAVQLNSQDALTPNVTAVDFGRIADGTSGTATITVTNNGQHPAKITGLETTGDGFHLAGNDCPPTGGAGLLPDGPSCRVTVTFTPTAAPYRGALSITADLSTAAVAVVIPLTGNGVGVPTTRSAPVITGTTTIGTTLNATAGAWGGVAPLAFRYQWLHCKNRGTCTPIRGATGTTYPLTAADLGTNMAVSVEASNAAGGGLALIGYAATTVTKPPPANQVPPGITGNPIDGSTLTATPGTWTGVAPISYSYQWRRCTTGGTCNPIPGATANTYLPSTADLNANLGVSVTATNPGGNTTIDSTLTTPVAAAPPVNQTHPSIVGPSLVGTTLTVDPGTWTGTGPITFDYQWLRCPSDGGSCDPIPGATTTQYTITHDDIEYWPSVEIHAHNPANTTVVAYTDDVPWVPWAPAG